MNGHDHWRSESGFEHPSYEERIEIMNMNNVRPDFMPVREDKREDVLAEDSTTIELRNCFSGSFPDDQPTVPGLSRGLVLVSSNDKYVVARSNKTLCEIIHVRRHASWFWREGST